MKIFIFGRFESIDVAGAVSAEQGRVQCFAPAHGFVTEVLGSMDADTGGLNQRMMLRSGASGQTEDFIGGLNTAGMIDAVSILECESPVAHPELEVGCNDWFTLDSQGDGATGVDSAGVCIVFETA